MMCIATIYALTNGHILPTNVFAQFIILMAVWFVYVSSMMAVLDCRWRMNALTSVTKQVSEV
jgi:hypothetical protein